MQKNRKKISRKILDEIIDKSMGNCYCGQKGDQIHHIDENPENNDFDNLIYVCVKHHKEASERNPMSRSITPEQLKKLRDKLYKHNDEKRRIELKHYSKTLKSITEANLYRAALDASIIVEITKARSGYDYGDWDKAFEILESIEKYSDYTSARIANEVFDFLLSISNYTRYGKSSGMASVVANAVTCFFPYPETAEEKKMCERLADKCCSIAHAMAYDALIYLHNLAIAYDALSILKFLHRRSVDLKLPKIAERVMFTYDNELKHNLNRPERTDLEIAKRFLEFCKNDRSSSGMRYLDNMPSDLRTLYEEHEDKVNTKR